MLAETDAVGAWGPRDDGFLRRMVSFLGGVQPDRFAGRHTMDQECGAVK